MPFFSSLENKKMPFFSIFIFHRKKRNFIRAKEYISKKGSLKCIGSLLAYDKSGSAFYSKN